VEGDAAEEIAGAIERHQGVDQTYGVTAERDSQPKYGHLLDGPVLRALPLPPCLVS
jgi:hypothetical protein